jgi:hypothetical protein
MAIATNEPLEEVTDRIRQEWGRMGGKMLRVKDLQSFESKTILSLFNVCTQIPKNLILLVISSQFYALHRRLQNRTKYSTLNLTRGTFLATARYQR